MITSPLPFKKKGRPVLDLALVGLVYFRNDTLNLEKGTREGNWLTVLHDD